jgi:predicted metal-dependent hydrolase
MDGNDLAPGFLAGVEAFNRREFFEAHEVWEDVWHACQGPTRDFFQGLIQVAVCLYHFRRGNTRGARKLCLSCRKYLFQFRPEHMGVDVNALLYQLDHCCAALLESHAASPVAELEPLWIPTIELNPRGEESSCV